MTEFKRAVQHIISFVLRFPCSSLRFHLNKGITKQWRRHLALSRLSLGRPPRGQLLSCLSIIGISILVGVLLSQDVALGSSQHSQPFHLSNRLSPSEFEQGKATQKTKGTVDEVPPQFELGQQLYLETCATCHVGIPPAVMPSQTWVDLLDDTQHYGVQIPQIVDPGRLIIWQYLEQFSRSLREDERTPYRVRNSRYFRVLHPKVEFDSPIRLTSCVSCHPGAPDFNYRQLTPEWQDAS